MHRIKSFFKKNSCIQNISSFNRILHHTYLSHSLLKTLANIVISVSVKTNQSYIISRMISWPHLISHLWLLKEAKRMQRANKSSECQILSAFLALGCLLPKRVQSMYKGELYVHLFEDSRQIKFNRKRKKWRVKLFQCMYLAYLKICLLDKVMEVPI